jgi:cellulose synthase/poly-beta-1,6-N-acetylglucosamine synthase-like glycosyltransferase
LNCITVVPGAVSGLRLTAIAEVGGISTDTLAEDTDLTLSLHKCGYRICYASQAIAWTEAPETLRTFAKQRFRWAFGTLQCLWKHRELLFNARFKALGWFSLPSAWFFNIFLVAFGSIIDLILLFSLLVSPANTILYVYFFVFLAAGRRKFFEKAAELKMFEKFSQAFPERGPVLKGKPKSPQKLYIHPVK